MKPGMEMPYAIFSSVPPALARDGLAIYCPQYLSGFLLAMIVDRGE
jgi:hypothetical protein